MIARLLVAVVLATGPFVDLGVAVRLPGWDLDAPVADLAATGLVALYLADRARGGPARVPAPPVAWAVAFAVVALFSALSSDPGRTHLAPSASAYWLLRKPVFSFVAYGVALPWALAGIPAPAVRRGLAVGLGALACLSIATSLQRIAAGDALWWATLGGLTPNHKALATFLAPFCAWLAWRGRWGLALAALAIALSLSKTAWLGTALALAFVLHAGGRPLVSRRWLVAALGVAGVAGLLALPWLVGDARLQDAARSRRSLDLRAWEMVRDRPLLGQGPGASTGWEQTEYPHYRVNGVEAHGVVQKVAAETGVVGLAVWAAFALALYRRCADALRGVDTHGERQAWGGVLAALHLQLLASTDAFTQGHWIPFGLAWWGLFRSDDR